MDSNTDALTMGKKFANGKVYINGIEGFWSFAKERLMKYHGVDP
jgi:transposase